MSFGSIGNISPVIASNAKQSRSHKRELDCFVARAPRNDGVSYPDPAQTHQVLVSLVCFFAAEPREDAVREGGVMRNAVWAALAVLLTVNGVASAADNYPSRPITVIVPFSAGGPSDAMARIL